MKWFLEIPRELKYNFGSVKEIKQQFYIIYSSADLVSKNPTSLKFTRKRFLRRFFHLYILRVEMYFEIVSGGNFKVLKLQHCRLFMPWRSTSFLLNFNELRRRRNLEESRIDYFELPLRFKHNDEAFVTSFIFDKEKCLEVKILFIASTVIIYFMITDEINFKFLGESWSMLVAWEKFLREVCNFQDYSQIKSCLWKQSFEF